MVDHAEELRDDQLAQRVQEGDLRAESELATRFRNRVFAVALARLGDFDAAQDITQETLLRVLEALREGRLEHPDKLGAFLCGTARNLVSNHLRARRPRSDADPDGLAAVGDSPEEHHSKHELGILAGKAIERLEPIDQKILLLTLVEGLSSDQVGERLGRSSSAVRQRKRRALQRARAAVLSMSQDPLSRH